MKQILLASALFALIPLAFASEGRDQIEADFDTLDSDDNGYVSAEEASGTQIAQYFSRIDTDSDGMLSKDEYLTFVKSMSDAESSNQ